MAIKNLFARGMGFGAVHWIATRGFESGTSPNLFARGVGFGRAPHWIVTRGFGIEGMPATIRVVGHRRRSAKDLAKIALKGARYLGRVDLDE